MVRNYILDELIRAIMVIAIAGNLRKCDFANTWLIESFPRDYLSLLPINSFDNTT